MIMIFFSLHNCFGCDDDACVKINVINSQGRFRLVDVVDAPTQNLFDDVIASVTVTYIICFVSAYLEA